MMTAHTVLAQSYAVKMGHGAAAVSYSVQSFTLLCHVIRWSV